MRSVILSFLLALSLSLGAGAARADRTYTNPDLASDAIRLEAQVKKDGMALAKKPTAQLRKEAQEALAADDAQAALKSLAGLLAANPGNAAAWLADSRAMITTGDSDETVEPGTTGA